MIKKIIGISFIIIMVLSLQTGCTSETVTTDEDGNEKKEFNISETANVDDAKININSVKRIENECSWEYDGECQSYTEPDNDYFLIIDVTIENNASEELNVSSLLNFELKDTTGETGEYEFLTESITSQLDGSIMSGDKLKGQIAFDVKESDEYYFYYNDVFDDKIKFIIKNTDIQ